MRKEGWGGLTAIALLGLALAACTQQDAANIQQIANAACDGAQLAAGLSVAISADVNASPQAQADAKKAEKVTTDTCAQLHKLPTVQAAQAQAIYRKWQHDMPSRILNSRKFQTFIESATK